MENWKDIVEKVNWASKAGLVPLFLMDCQAPMLDVMWEFFNNLFYQGHIYLFWA
jgi:hypothetical protein